MSTNKLVSKPWLSLTDGPVTNLEDLLLSRELRAKRQQQWLSLYNTSLISLTLVIPGEIKKSSGALFLFETALTAAKSLIKEENLNIINHQLYIADTGYEAFMAIDIPSEKLKNYTIQLETEHPLGRFWDFDVIDFQGILSRKQQKVPTRKCLICDEPAHACARSRKHDTKELLHTIEAHINAFNKKQ